MANNSLIGQSFSHNDIANLAKVIEISLRYYYEHTSPFEKDYFKELRTIAGLGFTAILVDGDLISIYERYLHTFLACNQFKITEAVIVQLALATAELTAGASSLFKVIGYPRYYEDFKLAFKNVANHMAIQLRGKTEDTEQLINIFLNKH